MSAKRILPDARDGLNEQERTILFCLHQLQHELDREFVPSIMLYGRVCEILNISEADFMNVFHEITK